MREIIIDKIVADKEIKAQGKFYPDERHYDELIDEDVKLSIIDGAEKRTVAVLQKSGIPISRCQKAFPALDTVRGDPSARGGAIGRPMENTLRQDGTQSKMRKVQPHNLEDIGSCDYFGFLEGNGRRNPRPSATSWTRKLHDNRPDQESDLIKYAQSVDAVFKEHMPDEWFAQTQLAQETPQYVIPGTCFSTLLANKSTEEKQIRFVAHKDSGDYAGGIGAMSCLWAGEADGFHLVLPNYCKAFRVRTGDVILYPIREFHGNTAFFGTGLWTRISAVFFYRAAIWEQVLKKKLPK